MIALYVLLIVLSMLFLLLVLPVRLRVTAGDELYVKFYFLCFRINLYPKRKKKTRKKGKKANKGDTSENTGKEKQKNGYIKDLFQKHGVRGGIGEIINILKGICGKSTYLMRHITVKKLEVDITVAGEDAAKTAIEYGAVNALVYPFLAFLDSGMIIKQKNVNIYCDFNTNKSKFSAEIFMGVKPWFVLVAAIGALGKIVAVKGDKNERKQ